jgi:hypothetical protein
MFTAPGIHMNHEPASAWRSSFQYFCTQSEETHEKSHSNRHRCRRASTNTNRRTASFYNSVAYYFLVFGRRQNLISNFTYTLYTYPYKNALSSMFVFSSTIYIWSSLFVLSRSPLTGIMSIHGYFRSLFFLTDGCGPLLRHPELPAPPYFTCHNCENNVHWLENAIQKVRWSCTLYTPWRQRHGTAHSYLNILHNRKISCSWHDSNPGSSSRRIRYRYSLRSYQQKQEREMWKSLRNFPCQS